MNLISKAKGLYNSKMEEDTEKAGNENIVKLNPWEDKKVTKPNPVQATQAKR